MQSETDPTLVTNTADATSRPWQFSIRGLMVLTFVMSVLFAFLSWWGLGGAVLFALITSPILITKGLIQHQLEYFVVGLMLMIVGLVPSGTPIIIGGCVILMITWLGDCVRKSIEKR